ncbi:hypothetical protein PTSG_12724 [Salpingoeca rosetta]|uniref:Uncharacterized protein n=1 Tax=Salpingoeca rosetta (strain ATCC 50818 / BSB-021) TaxID=946362 RepID=F2UJQ1_SALR5|nr:uncharacterized protein PTSG_12724 [Salpingoeca rosetta]EGD77350.1 hypothetical protein PTSG_12724 [Salpingoeca rosetta]|eukprot:XP_004990694.1 hypothetical protein PTSG_12724 [Salpingoeca rosetta]
MQKQPKPLRSSPPPFQSLSCFQPNLFASQSIPLPFPPPQSLSCTRAHRTHGTCTRTPVVLWSSTTAMNHHRATPHLIALCPSACVTPTPLLPACARRFPSFYGPPLTTPLRFRAALRFFSPLPWASSPPHTRVLLSRPIHQPHLHHRCSLATVASLGKRMHATASSSPSFPRSSSPSVSCPLATLFLASLHSPSFLGHRAASHVTSRHTIATSACVVRLVRRPAACSPLSSLDSPLSSFHSLMCMRAHSELSLVLCTLAIT